MSSAPKFIVVIGTSAGGIRALEELFAQLSPDMDAAFLVVLHLSRKGVGEVFLHRLVQRSRLRCKVAEHDEPIKRGVIYIAPPDEHLLVSEGRIVINHGAMENHWRPSINNLFRTAAAAYTTQVIGIILTGLLDDGAAGMTAIKRSGGITIVQDPNEADHPDMPLSVLSNIDVDHVESLANMGTLLTEIMAHTEPDQRQAPHDVIVETKIDLDISTHTDNLKEFERFEVNCPDCGGSIYITQKEHPVHYRCHIGHSFTERELLVRVSEVIEEQIWYLLRIMEERRTLLLRAQQRDKQQGYGSSAAKNLERAKAMEMHLDRVKKMMRDATKID